MGSQLGALTTSGWVLYDIMLGAGRGSAQLASRLDEAHLQVDSLISKGVHRGAHAALTSVGSDHGGVNFDAVGRGCAPGRSESNILTIGSAAARGAEAIASRVPATTVRL